MNKKINDPQEQLRLGQLKNLVMLAASDGQVTDSELAVLLAVASREDITPEDFNKVIEDPDSPFPCPKTKTPSSPTCATWWP